MERPRGSRANAQRAGRKRHFGREALRTARAPSFTRASRGEGLCKFRTHQMNPKLAQNLSFAPRDTPRDAKGRPKASRPSGTLFRAFGDPFSSDFGALGTWKNFKKCYTVDEFRSFRHFAWAHRKEVQKAPKSDPREAKMDPRSVPGGSRSASGVPRAAQEPPGAHPRAAQIPLSSGLDSQMGPTWRPRALRRPPRGHFGLSLGRFYTPRG